MSKRAYERTIFLDFLTEAQIAEAQRVANEEKQSVTDLLGKMVTKAIAEKPEAAAALAAARMRAMYNFAALISAPLSDLSSADELDGIDFAD